jgi:hypothetical protein
MNIKENKTFETSAKNIAYIIILPVIILASAVWFVEDSIAVTVAHLFQLICSLVFYFTSGYIWSLKSKKELCIFKFYLIFLSLGSFFTASIGFVLSLRLNPAWGNAVLFMGLFLLMNYPKPTGLNSEFPIWFSDLINKISVMLCICIMLMFTFWINPYSEPMKVN